MRCIVCSSTLWSIPSTNNCVGHHQWDIVRIRPTTCFNSDRNVRKWHWVIPHSNFRSCKKYYNTTKLSNKRIPKVKIIWETEGNLRNSIIYGVILFWWLSEHLKTDSSWIRAVKFWSWYWRKQYQWPLQGLQHLAVNYVPFMYTCS